jgi:hypothetical protein
MAQHSALDFTPISPFKDEFGEEQVTRQVSGLFVCGPRFWPPSRVRLGACSLTRFALQPPRAVPSSAGKNVKRRVNGSIHVHDQLRQLRVERVEATNATLTEKAPARSTGCGSANVAIDMRDRPALVARARSTVTSAPIRGD